MLNFMYVIPSYLAHSSVWSALPQGKHGVGGDSLDRNVILSFFLRLWRESCSREEVSSFNFYSLRYVTVLQISAGAPFLVVCLATSLASTATGFGENLAAEKKFPALTSIPSGCCAVRQGVKATKKIYT